MLLTRTIAIYAIIGAFLVGLATAGPTAWVLKGWKDSGEIQALRGAVKTQEQSLATLEGANGRCTAAVSDVQGAVKKIVDDGVARSKAAQAAMEKAAKEAAGHLAGANAALNRPPPAKGDECPALVRELLDYAKRRKGEP